jgi:hypothetical protein
VAPTPTPGPETVPLDGLIARGDLDLANAAAHIEGTLPGLPGLAGEVLVVGGNAYTRAPGQQKYSVGIDTSLPYNPADATSGPAVNFQRILATAADKSLSPELVGTEQEAGGACYHIRVKATPDVVKTQLGIVGEAVGYSTVDVWILQDSFLVERFELHTSDPTLGSAIRLVMSQYNGIAPIKAPAAGQYETPGIESPAAS